MYPTKDEILAALDTTDVSSYLPILNEWKDTYYVNQWSLLSNESKLNALERLCQMVALSSPNVELKTIRGKDYAYSPLNNTVILGKTASIMSTLHELGHAIIGWSELDACRFSVKLFQQIFPREYAQLEWQGHMLIRKQQ